MPPGSAFMPSFLPIDLPKFPKVDGADYSKQTADDADDKHKEG